LDKAGLLLLLLLLLLLAIELDVLFIGCWLGLDAKPNESLTPVVRAVGM
jgi:hypothetical protein